jgi:hypothetical protein
MLRASSAGYYFYIDSIPVADLLSPIQENVSKTRQEYERCLEQFNLARAKHEEQKSKGSKRSDEYKDRYLKVGTVDSFSCRRDTYHW